MSTNGRNLFTHTIELNRFLANARNDELSCFAEAYYSHHIPHKYLHYRVFGVHSIGQS